MADALIQLFGRIHPLVLHVPIGTLAALALCELLALVTRTPLERRTRLALVALFAMTAATAAGSGWVLAGEGYAGQTVTLHRWFGVALGVCSVALLVLGIARTKRGYWAGLALCLTLCAVVGHLGGSITHGERFLFEPFDRLTKKAEPAPVTTTDGVTPAPSPFYVSTIAPIFESKCVSCHGPDKQKGGLAMHTPEDLILGGDSGPAYVAGDPDQSDIVWRLRLAVDDEDHMPPENKPQPSEAEVNAIVQWIRDGADFGS